MKTIPADRGVSPPLHRLQHWAAIPLRLIVGYGFMEHGFAKLLRGPDNFAGILHAIGVPAPELMAWMTICIEIAGGLAVLAGAFVAWASIPMAAILVVAVLTVHLPNGFSSIKLQAVTAAGPQFGQPGYETDLLYLACLAALVLGGSGPLSVDGLLAKIKIKRLRSIAIFLPAVLFTLLAASPSFAKPTAETLRTSSASFTVFVDGPKEASKGIVLVHDWFGVSPSFLGATERLAKLGYRVVAVDLYDGRQATTHDEAGMLLGSLDADLAAQKIDAAIQFLNATPRQLAVMGFSMGAKHALASALRSKSVRATVLWYGETVNDPHALKSLQGPVLLIVGSADGPAAAENAAAFSKAADAAGPGAETYVYPGAAHAFAQPLFNQGKTYDPAATEAAWRLSEDFLRRRLTPALQ
jgi:putative oxidoreductase